MNPGPDNLNNAERVYYDGDCLFCNDLVCYVRNKNPNLELNNIRSGTNLEGVSESSHEKEIYIVTKNGEIKSSIDAIIAIAESVPNNWLFRLLIVLGKKKMFHPILEFLYKLFADNRFNLYGVNSRVFYVRFFAHIGFLIGILLSWKLWFGERYFPYVPVFEDLQLIPANIYDLVSILLVLSLVLGLVFYKSRIFSLTTLLLFGIGALIDQLKIQPWAFLYTSIIFISSFSSWVRLERPKYDSVLIIIQFVFAMVYTFSGLHKLTSNFFPTFSWLVEPFACNCLLSLVPIPEVLIPLVIGGLEAVFGLGLLFKRTRKISLLLTVLMHAFILISLGPFGHNWNSVVWPWNIFMIISLFFLFWKNEVIFENSKMNVLTIYVLIFFLFGPVLSLFNYWDSYLSFNLYSGNIVKGTLHLVNSSLGKPDELDFVLEKDDWSEYYIDINTWAMRELNVPVYPEHRVYESLLYSVAQKFPEQVWGLSTTEKVKIFTFNNNNDANY